MAADTYSLKIYSPAGLEKEDETSSLSMQAADGQIGILSEHTKYVGQLGTGVLEYVSSKTSEHVRAIINGGFCSFEDNTLSILADEFLSLEKVDRGSYDVQREHWVEKLKDASEQDPETQRAQRELQKIQAIDSLIAQ